LRTYLKQLGEDLALKVCVVDADRAATNLHAVQDEIVMQRTDLSEFNVDQDIPLPSLVRTLGAIAHCS